MENLETLERDISAWPEISVHPHRFGAREFRFRAAEIGHVHTGGVVDIPFPLAVRDALLADGLAEEHRWVPNSGWITFRIRHQEDLKHALWLMRLSYLRYALKTATDPRKTFEHESEHLHLSDRYKSLLEVFIPISAKQIRVEPISA
jgi:luciferase-like monooxygenase